MRYLLIIFCGLLLIPSPVYSRTWTTGMHTLEAEFVEIAGKNVALKKPDGETILVEINRLSAADKKYLRERSGRKRPKRPPVAKGARVQGGDAAIRRGLEKTVAVNFQKTPLGIVVDQLRQKTDIEIMLDIPALDEQGLSHETSVTSTKRKARFGELLNDITESLELIWDVQHEVIVITAAGNEHLFPVVYRTARDVDAFELRKKIVKDVETRMWDEFGGAGSILSLNDAIVVKHSWNIHVVIANKFADSVRPIAPGPLMGPTKIFDRNTSLNFQKTPLDEIIKHLRKEYRLAIDVDNDALDKADVNIHTPFSIRVEGVSLRAALNIMLDTIDRNLTWSTTDRGIVITTRAAADQKLISKTYVTKDLESAHGPDKLVEVIVTSLDSESWDETGGPGSIQAGPKTGHLTVRQTVHEHLKLHRLIQNLRQAVR